MLCSHHLQKTGGSDKLLKTRKGKHKPEIAKKILESLWEDEKTTAEHTLESFLTQL